MGWLQRMFGAEAPESVPEISLDAAAGDAEAIPPERVGLNGEYDQSGLAKRVALAFDQDSSLEDIHTLWVAQTGATVVLKGKVPSQEILDQVVAIANGVSGAEGVTTDEVTIE